MSWYGFYFDFKVFKYKDVYRKIEDELRTIFGNDLKEFLLLGERYTEDCYTKEIDNYIFVNCDNYSSYIKKIEGSNIIIGVLDNIQAPIIIPNEEVELFKQNMQKTRKELKLIKGDEVKVKEGIYSHLHGIIEKEVKNNSYVVIFKLKTKIIRQTLYRNNLIYIKNIFDSIRFPVLEIEEEELCNGTKSDKNKDKTKRTSKNKRLSNNKRTNKRIQKHI